MNKKLGFSALALSALSFGSFGIWIRIMSQELNVFQQIVLRNSVAALIALAIVIILKKYRLDFRHLPKIKLLLYSLAFPLSVIFYSLAVLNTKISVATFLTYVGSLVSTCVLSVICFKEKLSTLKIISIFLVITGLICFAYPLSINTLTLGLFAGLISGTLDGITNAFRKDLTGKIDKALLIFFPAVMGIVISFIALVFTQSMSFPNPLSPATLVAGLIVGSLIIIGNYLMLIGFQNFELGPGVIVLTLDIVFATLFGFILLGETLILKEIIGGLLIITAIILPNLNRHSQPKQI